MSERTRITHPRTTAARHGPTRPPAREIDELTALGELYLESLLRSQRRTAFGVCAATMGLLVALALAVAEFAGWRGTSVFGVQLPWVLVGFAIYPALVGIGYVGVRLLERNERAFAELMHQR
jgi:hypothetical protein